MSSPVLAQASVEEEPADPFVLRGTIAETPAVPAVPAAGDEQQVDPVTGKALRRQPVARAGKVIDDIETGSVAGRALAEAVDPYAPLGVRTGSFILYPSLTLEAGFTTNAAGAAGSPGSGYVTLTPEVVARSDWARHAATLTMRASDQIFFDGTTASRPTALVAATGRVDTAQDWSVALAGDYTFETQSLSDPNFPAGVDSPPGVHGLGAAVALNGDGRTIVQLEGTVDRTMYENGMSGGTVIDQSDRTNTVLRARGRLGYRVGASVAPFIEAEIRRRTYDRAVDDDGLMRSGWGQAYRAGIMIDRAPVLSGELAVGYTRFNPDDPGLAPFAAFAVDGALVWSPSALTTVTAAAATILRPGTDPASSGSVVHEGSLEFAYAWRRNVTLSARGGAHHEVFQGTGQIDTNYRAKLAATWKATRWLHVTGSYEHQWLVSTVFGRGYQSDAVMAAVRLQR